MFAYLIYVALVAGGFLFGLMYAGLLGESWAHRIGIPWFLLIAVSFSVVTLCGFLKVTRIPFRALLDIDAERRAASEGVCSAKNLRPEIRFFVVASAALFAFAIGQYVRLWSGHVVETAPLFFAAAVGSSITTALCWYRLKPGGLRT